MATAKERFEERRRKKESDLIAKALSEDNLLSTTGRFYERENKNNYGYTSLAKRWKNLYNKALGYYNNEGYKTFLDKYSSTRNTEGYLNSRDTNKWYRELEEMSKKDNEGIEELLAELDQYSRYYNEDAVKYLRDLISNKQKAYSDVMTDAGKFRDQWAKWATEDDYNNAVWESDFYSKLQNGDYDGAEKLIAAEYEKLQNSAQTGDMSSNLERLKKLSEYGEYVDAAKNKTITPNYEKYNGMSTSELLAAKNDLSGEFKPTGGVSPKDRLNLANSKMGIPDYDKLNLGAELMYIDERIPYQQMLEVDLGASKAEKDEIQRDHQEYKQLALQLTNLETEYARVGVENAREQAEADLPDVVARMNAILEKYGTDNKGLQSLAYEKQKSYNEAEKAQRLDALVRGAGEISGMQPMTELLGSMETDGRKNLNRVALAEKGMSALNKDTLEEREAVPYATYMSEAEKQVYNAYFASGQYDKAEEYYQLLLPELEKRKENQDLGKVVGFTDKLAGSGIPSALSVLSSLGSAVEFAGDAANYLVDRNADPYSAEMDTNILAKTTNAIRGTASEKLNFEIAGLDLYNIGMSGLDSLAASFIPYGGGVVLGLSAAAQATNDALERGMSSEQAFWNGAISGVFEGLFESLSIGKFKSLQESVVKGGKDIAKNIAKSMLVNASEEAATELANILYDTLANGDFSNYENMVRQYMSEGLSPEQAEAKAKQDLFYQVLESAASGAIMGAGFGGIGSAKAYSNAKNAALDMYGSDSEALIDESLALDPNNKLAHKLQGKLEAGKATSTAKLGKLALQNVNAAESAMVEQDKARNQADKEKEIKDLNVQKRLSGKIHDKEALSKIAQTVTKALMGEQVSNAELRKVAENQAALTLIGKELELKDLKVGTTTVSDLRSALAQKQSTKTRLSSENILAGYSAMFGMDEAAERSLMVNYAADVKNAEGGKTINPEDYAATYGVVYAAGKKGTDISEISKDAAKVLSKTAMAQAYRAGQLAAKNSQNDLSNGTDSDTIIKNAQEVQDEQGIHLRDSGEWNRSQNSQGQIPGMEGYAGQDQSRGESGTRPRDSGASSLSYDREEVSAESLGIRGGLTAKVRLVAEGSETASMKEAKRIAAERGLNVHFFGGGNLKISSGQKTISARAYIQSNDVYIRADHSRFTADQLMRHEAGHDMIAKGEVNVADVRKLINERFTPEEIDAVSKAYASAYEDTGLDADEIWEEVVCDSLADMNVFEGRKGYEAAAEMAADFLPDLREATLESRKEATGPPKTQEGKASRESRRIKYININNVVREEIKHQLSFLYGNTKNGVATEIAVAVGKDVYIIDSGKENGAISFGVRKIISISNESLRIEFIRRQNNDAVSNGYVSDGLSPKLRSKDDSNRRGDRRQKSWKELSDDQGKSENNQSGVLGENADKRGLKGKASIDLESLDSDYLSAVDRGDMETAQRMVDEAAKKAGYTDKLYHGTKQFGFTVFDPMKSDDGISLFAAGSDELAQTYSGKYGSKKISDTVNIEGLTDKEVVEQLNETAKENYEDREMKSEYEIMQLDDVNKLINSVNDGVEALADTVETKINEYAERMATDFNDSDAKVHRKLVELLDILEHYKYDDMSTPIYMLMHYTSAFDSNPEVADLEYKIRLMNKLQKVDTTNGIVVKKDLDGYGITLLTFDESRAELEEKNKSGNYALFGKPKNQLVIDGKGQPWNNLKNWTSSLHYKKENTYVDKKDGYYRLYNKKTGEHIFHGRIEINEVNDKMPLDQMHSIMVQKANNSLVTRSEYKKTTRDVAQFAKELGYDSIKFENIEDNGGRGESVSTGDVYVYFNSSDLKSADPVTYDDNGNVIPLSERFNSENADIRFSQELFEEFDEDVDAEVVEQERSTREMLANMLERDDMSSSQKGMLTQYKNKIAQISENEARIASMTEELRALNEDGKGKGAKAENLRTKIRKLEQQNANYETAILNLEATKPIKRLLERERRAAYQEGKLTGQMAQGREDAAKLRRAEEKLAEQKRIERERLEAQRQKTREMIAEQSKKYMESRAKSVEGRSQTAMRHKIQKVVAELDKLLRHGNKKRNVKLGLQDAVAAALEAFDINAEKAERYVKDMARLDAKIEAATDPMEIEALKALREKKQRNSELLADKLAVMKKAYEDIHNNENGENYPSYYRAEAKIIMDRIGDVMSKVGNTPIGEMTSDQLKAVYDMYRMVLTTVRDANKAFINGKLEDLTDNANDVTQELQKIKKLPEERLKAGDNARGFVWNELTPYYAFKRIGSETLMRYYDELVRGQDVYARDLDEAKSFAENLRKKYKADSWNRNKVVAFKDKDGKSFKLNLGQMMSIYAYSKREQALDHMEKGGFFFNNKETFRTDKSGLLEFISSNETGYKIDSAALARIKSALTADQVAYVDKMQAYLTDMGAKGNEVSRKMWGIDIFNEKVYFPLKSKDDFIYQANTPAETSSLKNDGMTKETKPHASNPIVLESFDEVWANHVNKMSMYHGFVVPIDNLNKLINYGSWIDGDAQSISTILEARFSSAVNDYLTTFIKDLNGAKSQNGGLLGVMSNWLTKFKKTAVAASLSVVVQQPTAILRATSEIDAKYFAHLPKTWKLNSKWERIQKYAPIAIIKDIGGFDAGSGRQITEWLNSDTRQGVNKAMNKLDDMTMYGAALGDRAGWGAIWTAVEREVQAKQKLKYGTEEFWQACGKRFTDIIVKTQVYDSTLSRSGFMRGKDGLLKMATAFMGEPTLSINMLADAVLQGKRGTMKKRQVIRTVAAVYTATIAASVIKSLVYALRDDDEDESFAEKYMQALGGSVLNDVNPLSMLPIFRDVVSILDGWEVERTDMAIVQDLYNAITALSSENKTTWRKIEDLTGAVGALAGVPAKNLLRTVREFYNAVNDAVDGIKGGDVGGAFIEGVTGKEKSKSQTLYEALIGGEKERIAALRKDYKTDEDYKTAVRTALRKYDPRIKKAAQALYEGDLLERNEIMLEILGEGVFDKTTVDKAIDAEKSAFKNKITEAAKFKLTGNDKEYEKILDDLLKDYKGIYSEEEIENLIGKARNEQNATDDFDAEAESIYVANDINLAFDYNTEELALEIIAELTEIKVTEKLEAARAKAEAKGNYFDEDEAREEAEYEVASSLRSTMTKYWKPKYQAAYYSNDTTEMYRIEDILYASGLYEYKSSKTLDDVLEEWIESDEE